MVAQVLPAMTGSGFPHHYSWPPSQQPLLDQGHPSYSELSTSLSHTLPLYQRSCDVHHQQQAISFVPSPDASQPVLSDSKPGSRATSHLTPNSTPAQPADPPMERGKPIRAVHACENCRQRKSKCNEARPCGNCVRNDLTCIYRRPPPPAQKAHVAEFAGMLDAFRAEMSSSFGAIRHEVEVFKMQVHSLESKLTFAPGASPNAATRAASFTSPLPTPNLARTPQVATPTSIFGDLALPAEHSTGAHNLLDLWNSIKPFGPPENSQVKQVACLMSAETRRENLDLYGKFKAGHANDLSGSPAPRPQIFAQGEIGIARSCHVGAVPAQQILPGGLHEGTGLLCLDSHTISQLFDTYCQKMHALQPFLNIRRLSVMIQDMSSTGGPFYDPNSKLQNLSPGLRKRKWASAEASGSPVHLPNHLLKIPQRSIDTAILMLVCALGRICQVQEDLDQAMNNAADAHFRAYGQTPRNVDVVPGLAYYAYGVSILGELHGGHSLQHVSAYLLCGLYMGQLLRVLDSYRWIHSACTSCQILISHFDSRTPPNAVRIAFWSCLQMESDILAELNLPPSGISRFEDQMQFPDAVSDTIPLDGRNVEDERILLCFYAQIALRKLLNRAHSQLYGRTDGHYSKDREVITIAQDLADQLEHWRQTTQVMAETHGHHSLSWSDNDDPPSDINVARLWGKYYGARYVILRVFLRQLLEGEGTDAAATDANASSWKQHQGSPAASHAEGKPLAIDLAYSCIQAAVKSTLAFDGVRTAHGRLMVTNIFGTAHAQFGNMLVLSAVANSPDYQWMFTPQQHRPLMQRTVEFFEPLAHLSPAMANDLAILLRARTMIETRSRVVSS